jgi:hypothetical protein
VWDIWFINAHKKIINSIQLCENYKDKTDTFVISASNDFNVLIHRLSNGVCIGQLGSGTWDITDMTPYEKVKPRYVQNWFNLRLKAFLKYTELKNEKMAKNPEYEAKKDEI